MVFFTYFYFDTISVQFVLSLTLIARNKVAEKTDRRESTTSVIRITLASMDEYNILLQNGLNFYDATFFPTEANLQMKDAKIDYKRRYIFCSFKKDCFILRNLVYFISDEFLLNEWLL